MRWITSGGPEPILPGWYPTISRWDAHSLYVAGTHRWDGSDWVSIAPECVTCYYLEPFDNAHEARERARELDAGIGLLRALGVVADGESVDDQASLAGEARQDVGWLGQARRRLMGSTIPPR